MNPTRISELKPTEKHGSLDIRILNRWNPHRSSQLCFLFIDRYGDAIEAIQDSNSSKNFKKILHVGSCYSIRDYICAPSRKSWKVVPHGACIRFGRQTTVSQIQAPEIPHYYFHFASYEELRQRIDNHTILTDYISLLEKTSPGPTTKDGQALRLHLRDESNNCVIATLWPETSKTVDEDAIGSLQHPVFAAMTSMKVTSFNNGPQMGSTNATIVTINPAIPQVEALTTRFADLTDAVPTQAESTVNSSTVLPLSDIVNYISDPKNRQLTFTCLATISAIPCDEGHSWFYISCNQCKKRAYKTAGLYECPDHDPSPQPKYRYCMTATITDDTSFVTAVLFDEAMATLIDITCDSMVKDEHLGDPQLLPPHLKSLIGKRMLFEVQARNTNKHRASIVINKAIAPPVVTPDPVTPTAADIQPTTSINSTTKECSPTPKTKSPVAPAVTSPRSAHVQPTTIINSTTKECSPTPKTQSPVEPAVISPTSADNPTSNSVVDPTTEEFTQAQKLPPATPAPKSPKRSATPSTDEDSTKKTKI